MTRIRSAALLALASILFFGACARAASSPIGQTTVCTTQPWMTSMASFIAGTTIDILPLRSWTQTGTLRSLRRAPNGAVVIALDPKDAAACGISRHEPTLHMLYSNFPVRESSRISLAFDPSALPFMSQRLLIVISELEPDNYPFYQRRLAEFQSRLESSLEVGRSLVGEMRMLDLTGGIGPWIKAASPETVRPPDELWSAWLGSTRTNELRAAIDEAKRRRWWIITDAWTPAIVLKIASAESRYIHINAPDRPDYEFFSYLHDIYLNIWNAATKNSGS